MKKVIILALLGILSTSSFANKTADDVIKQKLSYLESCITGQVEQDGSGVDSPTLDHGIKDFCRDLIFDIYGSAFNHDMIKTADYIRTVKEKALIQVRHESVMNKHKEKVVEDIFDLM